MVVGRRMSHDVDLWNFSGDVVGQVFRTPILACLQVYNDSNCATYGCMYRSSDLRVQNGLNEMCCENAVDIVGIRHA